MIPFVQDISFVVIARNEQDRLSLCLDSITRLELANCEVICVNSSSTDGTLDVMMSYKKQYPFFIVLSPAECRNAATARNHGIRAASKSKIFFVDGDIELNAKFVHSALEQLKDPKISAVTGGLDEILYDDVTARPIMGPYVRHSYTLKSQEISCGGVLIAKTEAVQKTGYYDERFYVNEDSDYTLRLTSKFQMVALDVTMGIHHTGVYKKRPWLFLKNGYVLNHGMLAHKHFRRPDFWSLWYRCRKVVVWGFIAGNILLSLSVLYMCDVISGVTIATFFTALLLFEISYSILRKQSLLSTLIRSLLWPYAVMVGFFLEPFIGGSGDGKANDPVDIR